METVTEDIGAPMPEAPKITDVCDKCGLPITIMTIGANTPGNGEKMKILVKCFHQDHNKIEEVNSMEEYKILILKISKINAKCVVCGFESKHEPKKKYYYCTECEHVRCENCIGNGHDRNHICYEFIDIFSYCESHPKYKKLKYCLDCKEYLCEKCIELKKIHADHKTVYTEQLLKESDSKIKDIQKEKFELEEKINDLSRDLIIHDFIISKYNDCKTKFNSIPFFSTELLVRRPLPNSIVNNCSNKKVGGIINAIYYDINFNLSEKDEVRISTDAEWFEKEINGTLILVTSEKALKMLLEDILIYNEGNKNSKATFELVVNGGNSENTIKFLENNNYMSIFNSCCIFTSKKSRYKELGERYKNFILEICTRQKDVIRYLESRKENSKINYKFEISQVLTFAKFNKKVLYYYKDLASHFNSISDKAYLVSKDNLIEFLKRNKESFLHGLEKSELVKNINFLGKIDDKIFKKLVVNYLEEYFYKNEKINSQLSYIFSYLINEIYRYSEKNGKKIEKEVTLYKGTIMKIADLLEYVKYRSRYISIPYFNKVRFNRGSAELDSKKNLPNNNPKNSGYFSVIYEIKYKHKPNYNSPCIDVDNSNFLSYLTDCDVVIMPFTFYKLIKGVSIDNEQCTAFIQLEILGREEVIEDQLKMGKSLVIDEKNGMIITQ